MVNKPSPSDVLTPQRHGPSDPTWSIRKAPSANVFTSSRSTFRTPSSAKSNSRTGRARASPYMTPDPKDLFRPKDKVAEQQALRQKATSSPRTPSRVYVPAWAVTPGRARPPGNTPKTLLFPPNLEVRDPSALSFVWVSPPMHGTSRPEARRVERPRDPGRPTVQLFKVMEQCWDIDTEKESRWTIRDGLLNGRNDVRDRRTMWDGLSCAVRKVWPELRDWIMRNAPTDDDATWFKSAKSNGVSDEEAMHDPDLATKYSSLERVGFHMTSSTYDTTCSLVEELAGRGADFSGINPFFMIYACADRNIPLPSNISRQFLWTHLDAILQAKCWRGLGSVRAKVQPQTSTDANHVPPRLFRKGEDPEDTLQSLLRLSCGRKHGDRDGEPPRPVHKLQITIKDYAWVAKTQMGTIWYQAGDLYDDDDIGCMAVIESLTRLLPSCWGSILEISTDHIRLLWGVGGTPSGAWTVVRAVCRHYQVVLRAKWSNSPKPNPHERITSTDLENITVPPRDSDVVDAFLHGFKEEGLENKAEYRCMMDHLRLKA